MSDANWDMEYDKAYDMKKEIIELCVQKGISIPYLDDVNRSWLLEPILKKIKLS